MCSEHRGILVESSKHCAKCLRNADAKQEKYDLLYEEILDNLRAEVSPDDPDKFVLVQRLVTTHNKEDIGALGRSGYETSLKASQRMVAKTKGSKKLGVLDDQNSTYLKTGK